jgi:hypothetical protein
MHRHVNEPHETAAGQSTHEVSDLRHIPDNFTVVEYLGNLGRW